MALAQAKLDLTETRLAEMPAPTGEAGWAGEARAAAVARVRAMGLPTRRDEYWKYTDPATLTQGRGAARSRVRGRRRGAAIRGYRPAQAGFR